MIIDVCWCNNWVVNQDIFVSCHHDTFCNQNILSIDHIIKHIAWHNAYSHFSNHKPQFYHIFPCWHSNLLPSSILSFHSFHPIYSIPLYLKFPMNIFVKNLNIKKHLNLIYFLRYYLYLYIVIYQNVLLPHQSSLIIHEICRH